MLKGCNFGARRDKVVGGVYGLLRTANLILFETSFAADRGQKTLLKPRGRNGGSIELKMR